MPNFTRPFETYANYYKPMECDGWSAIVAWDPEDKPGFRSIDRAGLTPYLYEEENQAKLACSMIGDSRYEVEGVEWASVEWWKHLRDDVVAFWDSEAWPMEGDEVMEFREDTENTLIAAFVAWRKERAE